MTRRDLFKAIAAASVPAIERVNVGSDFPPAAKSFAGNIADLRLLLLQQEENLIRHGIIAK